MAWQRTALQQAPQAIAAIGAYTLVLSVAYEYGFFWSLDLDLVSLFSIDQLISNAMNFVPISVGSWLIYRLAASLRDKYRTENSYFQNKIRRKPSVMSLAVLGVIGIASIVASQYWATTALFFSIFYFVCLIILLAGDNEIKEEIMFLIYTCIISFLIGASQFETRLHKANYELFLKDGEIMQVEVAKFTSKYIFFFSADDRLTAISNDEINQISILKSFQNSALIDISPAFSYVRNLLSRQSTKEVGTVENAGQ